MHLELAAAPADQSHPATAVGAVGSMMVVVRGLGCVVRFVFCWLRCKTTPATESRTAAE